MPTWHFAAPPSTWSASQATSWPFWPAFQSSTESAIVSSHWFPNSEYWHYLELSEIVNVRVFEILDQTGVALSLPERFTYTDQESQAVPLGVNLSEDSATRKTTAPKRKR